MSKNSILGGINFLQYVFTVAQTNEVFQVIELCLAILTSIVLLAYRIWHWYKEAKKDGIFDDDEIDEVVDIIKDGVEDLKNDVEKEKNKNDIQ